MQKCKCEWTRSTELPEELALLAEPLAFDCASSAIRRRVFVIGGRSGFTSDLTDASKRECCAGRRLRGGVQSLQRQESAGSADRPRSDGHSLARAHELLDLGRYGAGDCRGLAVGRSCGGGAQLEPEQ